MGSGVIPAESKGFPVHMNKYCDYFFKEFERRVGRLRNTLFILVNKDLCCEYWSASTCVSIGSSNLSSYDSSLVSCPKGSGILTGQDNPFFYIWKALWVSFLKYNC